MVYFFRTALGGIASYQENRNTCCIFEVVVLGFNASGFYQIRGIRCVNAQFRRKEMMMLRCDASFRRKTWTRASRHIYFYDTNRPITSKNMKMFKRHQDRLKYSSCHVESRMKHFERSTGLKVLIRGISVSAGKGGIITYAECTLLEGIIPPNLLPKACKREDYDGESKPWHGSAKYHDRPIYRVSRRLTKTLNRAGLAPGVIDGYEKVNREAVFDDLPQAGKITKDECLHLAEHLKEAFQSIELLPRGCESLP